MMAIVALLVGFRATGRDGESAVRFLEICDVQRHEFASPERAREAQ